MTEFVAGTFPNGFMKQSMSFAGWLRSYNLRPRSYWRQGTTDYVVLLPVEQQELFRAIQAAHPERFGNVPATYAVVQSPA